MDLRRDAFCGQELFDQLHHESLYSTEQTVGSITSPKMAGLNRQERSLVIQFDQQQIAQRSYMMPLFDILKVESGRVRWMEAVADLERAKARVKVLAVSSPGEYIILNQKTREKISIKPKTKRILFQIGYDEKGLNARAELFRRFGHDVISVTHNEAAKVALSSFRDVDLFIVGHSAPEQARKEMVDWLKTNYPKVKILALNPSDNRKLSGADYNVILNDHDEWLSLLAAAAS